MTPDENPGDSDSSPWVAPGQPTSPSPAPPPAAPPPPPPPFQPPPFQPQVGAPPSSTSAWTAVAIVGAVVAVLVAVVGVVVITNDDDSGPRRRSEDSGLAGDDDGTWSTRGPTGPDVAVVTDGEQVCTTDRDELVCVDGATGDRSVSVDLPADASPPTLAGETLVVAADGGAGRGDVYGYSLDGDLLWEATGLQDVDVETLVLLGTPLPAAGDVVAVSLGRGGLDGVVGIDARTGQELWRAGGVGNFDGSFAVVGDLISDSQRFYGNALSIDASAAQSGVVAVDPATGSPLWEAALSDATVRTSFMRTAVVNDDGSAVALGSHGLESSEVVVIDLATGVVRWRVPLDADRLALAYLDGVTVVADETQMWGYDAQGVPLWTTDVPGSASDARTIPPQLVVTGGRLFALAGPNLFEVGPEDGDSEIVMQRFLPVSVVATDTHLVAIGLEWVGIPL